MRSQHLVETCHIQVGLKQFPECRWRFLWLWALVGSPGLEARLDRSLVAEQGEQGLGKAGGAKLAALYPSLVLPNSPPRTFPKSSGVGSQDSVALGEHLCCSKLPPLQPSDLSPALNGAPDACRPPPRSGRLSQQMGGGRGCTSATFLQVQGASSLESFEVRWQGQPTVPQSSYYIMSMKLLPAKPMCSHQQDTCNSLIWFGTRLTPILQARRFRKELSFTCGQVSSRAVSEPGPMAQRQRSGLGRAVLPLSGLCCGMEGKAEVTMAV